MRERRWESQARLKFGEVLSLSDRLAALGLKPVTPERDVICYIEEWRIREPADVHRLDAWSLEDVTLVHIRNAWRGDFFILAGGYHTMYQKHYALGTYCSVSHPWKIRESLMKHHSKAMLWLGFRDEAHSFVRVRLHTTEIIAPGETRADDHRALWLEERRRAFLAGIQVLDLPVEAVVERGKLLVRTTEPAVLLLCSWPDAFGPCQFEYNSSDPFQFLVPASQLVATYDGEPAEVRAYLTGFSESALKQFEKIEPEARYAYRCSVHCPLRDLPDVLQSTGPASRVYTTLCEFQTQELVPRAENAWVILGVMGEGDGFKVEARLNRAHLGEDEMAGWLGNLLGVPVVDAPLPPFP